MSWFVLRCGLLLLILRLLVVRLCYLPTWIVVGDIKDILVLLHYSVEFLSVLLRLLLLMIIFNSTSLMAGAAHRKWFVLRIVFLEIVTVTVLLVLIIIIRILIMLCSIKCGIYLVCSRARKFSFLIFNSSFVKNNVLFLCRWSKWFVRHLRHDWLKSSLHDGTKNTFTHVLL